MDVAAVLLAKNLIPVLQHSNDTYELIEREGAKAAAGLLPDARVHVVVSRSTRPNAYCFRTGREYVITLTDSLLRRMEDSVAGLLNAPEVQRFAASQLELPYEGQARLPDNMTGGLTPSSQRHAIGTDIQVALFYEAMDSAWLFGLLHEIAHIRHGDIDGKQPEKTGDVYQETVRALELSTYGGTGPNRHRRYAEYLADREAATWLMQIVFRTYIVGRPDAERLGPIHLVLAAFGMLVAVLQISHYGPDTPASMAHFDHPSFDARLEGAWEGLDAVMHGTLPAADAFTTLHVITELRQAIETVVLGEPSKYVISV